MLGERSTAKNYRPVSLLSVITKVFEKLVNNSILDPLKSYRISGQIFALFLLFSVIDGLEWFWMKSLHKNIQLMLEFLNATFLV